MSEEDRLLNRDAGIRAEGQSRINAVGGDVNAETVNFGDRYDAPYLTAPPNIANIEVNPESREQTEWIDREAAQRELLARVQDEQTVLMELVAAGGAGKTSLAVWLQDEVQAAGTDVIWVRLSEASSFYEVARWVLYGVGVPTNDQMDEVSLIKMLIVGLKKRQRLVLLDQLEKVAAVDERRRFETFLAQWQRKGRKQQGRNSTVLVTTRQQYLTDEKLRLRLSGFTPVEGEAFLAQQGIVAESSEWLQALSEVCSGHPLLLKLSAGWLAKVNDARLHEDDLVFFEKLFQQDLRDLEAQVEEIFRLLLERLSEPVRRALLDASVYRGSFGLAQAQAMVSELALEDLEGLEAQGFLLVQKEKWRLHPLVNELVAEALRAEGGEETAHRKAIEYFEARLESEITDIQDYLDCFHHYCECQDFEAACDVILPCYGFLFRQGCYRVLVSVYERLEEWETSQLQKESREKYAATLIGLGNAYDSLGEYDKAIDYRQQALAIQKEIGDHKGEANALCNLGNTYYFLGKYGKAIDYQQRALAIAKEIGDLSGEVNALGNLGSAYDSLGEYGKAIDYQQQALKIFKKMGDYQSEAASLCNLGNVYRSLGEYGKAIDYQQQALAIRKEVGDRSGEAASLCNLGNAHNSLGEYGKAIDYQQRSLAIFKETDNRNGEATSLCNLGNVYRSLGQYGKATDYLQKSLAIRKEIGDRNGEAASLCNLGDAYRILSKHGTALRHLQQSLAIFKEVGNRNGEAKSLCNLGIAHHSLGEYRKAIEYLQQSLAIQREIGDRNGKAISLLNLGLAYAKIDEHWKSREHYEQAKALFIELKLAHMIKKCEKAIQERNQIIAGIPKKAPSLPTKKTEPDWWAKSQPAAACSQKEVSKKQSLPGWLFYLAIAVVVALIVITLQ